MTSLKITKQTFSVTVSSCLPQLANVYSDAVAQNVVQNKK